METKTHSLQFLRKRKFLLVLPVLVVPFITLLFWSLGGGKENGASATQPTAKVGINVQLPDANLKDDKSLNKLSYYEKAASDSQKLEEQLKNDPFYQKQKRNDGLQGTGDTGLLSMKYKQNVMNGSNNLNTSPYNSSGYTDPNEAKVYKKLNELNVALNQAPVKTKQTKDYPSVDRTNKVSVNSADIDRLEQMMNMNKNNDNSEDPEMKQLNGMMDKILDIQHPERVKEKIKQSSATAKGQVYAVTTNTHNDNTSLLTGNKPSLLNNNFGNNVLSANGFFSLVDDMESSTEQPNAIQAVIHETQTVVEGSIVKLRLVNDIAVNSSLIPKGSFVFGTASLNGERLTIKINSIRYKSSVFPVQLSVVDMDGMEGIYVPGSITREVAGNSAERAIQNIGITSLDPSLSAQAMGAGIEAAKTLLTKKAKLIKITLKAGYQVLLRDEKQKP